MIREINSALWIIIGFVFTILSFLKSKWFILGIVTAWVIWELSDNYLEMKE